MILNDVLLVLILVIGQLGRPKVMGVMRFIYAYMLAWITGVALSQPSVVVSGRAGGRLGDQIMAFAKGRLCAYKYKIPFYYENFSYANALMLSKLLKTSNSVNFAKMQTVKVSDALQIDPQKNGVAWKTNFYSLIPGYSNLHRQVETNLENVLLKALDDVQFGNLMRALLQPISSLQDDMYLSKKPLVGIHYRFGSGGDPSLASTQEYVSPIQCDYHLYKHPISTRSITIKEVSNRGADDTWPTKFPPLQYYLEQLQLVSKLCIEPPVILLCTDHRDAGAISEIITRYLRSREVPFRFVKVVKKGVVGDMNILSLCDILIRGDSNFARASQLMGNHAIIIRPFRYRWLKKKLCISEVAIDVRSEKASKLIKWNELIAICS